MTRSRRYTVAAILQAVLSLVALGLGLMDLPQGAANAETPYFVVVITLLIGALGLVLAYGVWRGQRWGVVLTILLRVVDGLLTLPAIVFAAEPWLEFGALVAVVMGIAVIVLLLWPVSRTLGLRGAESEERAS